MTESPKSKAGSKSAPAAADPGEVLRPFHEAAVRFVQANEAAREAAARESAEAWLDVQGEVHSIEHESFEAIAAANRRALAAVGNVATENPEEAFIALTKANIEIGSEIQKIQAETAPKLADVAQAASGERSTSIVDRYIQQRQAAYQAYVGEVQTAWSGVTDPNPQTMSTIAQYVLGTLATVYA